MNSFYLRRSLLILHCLSLLLFGSVTTLSVKGQDPGGYQNDCGNDDDDDNDGGNCSGCEGGDDDDAGDCDDTGANPINPYRANVHREVSDITTFGPAPISFTRQANSRNSSHGGFNDSYWELGYRQIWQHNWNYEMRWEGNNANSQYILLRYPNGNEYDFTPLSYPVQLNDQLVPVAWNGGDRLYVTAFASTHISACTLVTAKGEELDFEKSSGDAFHLIRKRNGLGWSWTCTYSAGDSSGRLMRVTNNFGRWIEIHRVTGADGVLRIDSVSTGYGSSTYDGRLVTYSYSQWASSGKFVLSSVIYPGGEQASYSHVTSDPTLSTARPLISTADDPTYRHGRPGAHIKYVYNYNARYPGSNNVFVPGTLMEERNGVTDQPIIRFPLGGGAYPQILEGDGTEVTRKFTHGRLTTKRDGAGRNIVFARDSNGFGFVNSKTDHRGVVTQYERDYAGRVKTRTATSDGSTRKNNYYDLGFRHTHEDEMHNMTEWVRNVAPPNQPHNSRVTRKNYPDGTYEEWPSYNPNSLPLTHRLRNGGTEYFTYDLVNGNMLTHTDPTPEHNVTTYTYYPNGLMSSMTDARLNTTSYTYNWRGQVLTVTPSDSLANPIATPVTYEYDDFGNRTTVTDELGHTTTYKYDEYNRVEWMTDPRQRKTVYEYGRAPSCNSCSYVNTISRITSAGGRMTTFSYDGAGRMTCKTVGAETNDAATTSRVYNDVANTVTRTDPRGKVWIDTYDDKKRKISAEDPLHNKTEWTYWENGKKKTEKRPGSNIVPTQFFYDEGNRLWKIIDPAAHITEMKYTHGDKLWTIKDANAHTYTFDYDLMDRKKSLTYPGESVERWDYDAVGNVATYTTRAGQIKTSSYDNRNRETAFTWSDGTDTVSKTYDAAGRLLTLENNASILSYTYDEANQLTSETQQIIRNWIPFSVTYKYDGDGNRLGMTYPDGGDTAYTYTGRNQLATVTTDGSSPSVSYVYDANGNRAERHFDNNIVASYDYDDANRLTQLEHDSSPGPGNVSTSVIAAFTYGYNNLGNRTYAEREDGTGDAYTYDEIDQVKRVKYGVSNPEDPNPSGANRDVSYSYDDVGNRTNVSDGGQSTGYTPNNLNQYTAVGIDVPSYDAIGNLTSQGEWTYYYDAQNRLMNASNLTTQYDFAYDGRNRCVARLSQEVGGAQLSDPPFTFYYYDRWNLIAEHDPRSKLDTRYLHGAQIDELVARIGGGGTFYYHQDALGNTVALTDTSGNVAERYSYDVYGAPSFFDSTSQPLSSSTVGNRFLFTGREYLADLGLYDYRNRMYAPEFGRFLQTDPVRFDAKDVNLYRYVFNGPTMLIDPSGRFGVVPGYIGAIVVGAGAGALGGSTVFGVGAIPGAVIGGIAAAIIFTPTTSQAPAPPPQSQIPPDDDESTFNEPDPYMQSLHGPDSYTRDFVIALEDCLTEWEEIAGECAYSDDPEIQEAFETFMDGCLTGKGF